MGFSYSEPSNPIVEETVANLYDELRAVAAHHFRHERADHTLQPTAVVHEVYLRLAKQKKLQWENRLHFLNIAAAQIRRILVDHARTHGRLKRGGNLFRVTFDESICQTDQSARDFDLLALDAALDLLEAESTEDRRIVELKFFGGLIETEIATVMGVSERTIRRRWLFSRTWLFRQLEETS